MTFLLPTAIAVGLGFTMYKDEAKEAPIYIVNSDKGSEGQNYVDKMLQKHSLILCSKEHGIEKLKKKQIAVCYEIPATFSEDIHALTKPTLIAHKTESNVGSVSTFQLESNNLISQLILCSHLQQRGIPMTLEDFEVQGGEVNVIDQNKIATGDRDLLHILISFIFFDAIVVASFLLELKKENVLQRSLTTAHSPATIFGGVILANFIFLFLAFFSAFFIQAFLRGAVKVGLLPIIALNIAFAVLTSLSLGVCVSRICKNEVMIIVVVQFVAWITCFLGGSFAPLDYLPEVIQYFARFTPQYWITTSIETNNFSLSFVTLLFALALFTIGTFKANASEAS